MYNGYTGVQKTSQVLTGDDASIRWAQVMMNGKAAVPDRIGNKLLQFRGSGFNA
jgi:hypothetical protein